MRKHKKGFTIVELVIVIAVIAVLTAVLVPTFIHLSSKAKDSIDKTVVKNANIQLAAKQGVEGKNKSMSDAVKDVDEIGYHIPGVETANGNKIVWDSESDRFVLLDKDNEILLKDSNEVSAHSKLFYAVSSDSAEEREDFAIYAKSNYSGATSFTQGISFDAGDKEGITEISYVLDAEDTSKVLVVTNSEDTVLTVNAPKAEFVHDNLVGKEYVEAVAPHSFTEFGKVGYAKVDSGHYIADQGANVKGVFVTSNDAVVDKQNGGVIEAAYGEDNTVTNEPGNVDLSYGKTEEQVRTKAMDDLEKDVNPPSAVEVDNNNVLGIFDGTHTEYVLVEDVNVDLLPIVIEEGWEIHLDLNGHNFSTNKGIDEFDYFFNKDNDTFIENVSCLVNKGKLVLTGEGIVGGPKGWFGIYNDGELVLDGPTVRGGTIYFSDVGVTVPFGAISNDGTMTAEGYSEKSGGNIYSRD